MDIQKPAIVQHFLQRAESFYHAAQDLDELLSVAASDYTPAIGLLSVHGCIALTDALLIATDGERPHGDNHNVAADKLRAACARTKKDVAGIKYFDWLLGKKTDFSYGERRVDEQELRKAKEKMDQFFKWAYATFEDVAAVVSPMENAHA